MDDYLHTTSHDFKSNFSRYLKFLMQGEYEGVVVKHYKKPVGVFVLLEPLHCEADFEPEPDESEFAPDLPLDALSNGEEEGQGQALIDYLKKIT